MAKEKTPRTKSQTLSLRLDPKTRFVLEFLAKINRQSITTVVEEAIRSAGSEGEVHSSSFGRSTSTWIDYWDISDGIRTINMLADRAIPSSYEDDELREFIQWHIEFFSETYELKNPDRMNVAILWPKIENYVELWRESKQSDPWAAGRVMADDLRDAEVEPPEWPRQTKSPPRPKSDSSENRTLAAELDDEIPF